MDKLTKKGNPSDILSDQSYPNYAPYNEFQQYSTSSTKDHECKHEDDWREQKQFKDRVIEFIGAKNEANGALKDTDNTLAGRLTRIEDKVDTLLFAMLGAMGTAIIALLVAIISMIR